MTDPRRAARWWRRLAAMTRKEVWQLRRDLPLLLFLLYSFSLSVYISGAGITMQLQNPCLLGHDADHSLFSRELIHRFHSPYFRFIGGVGDSRQGLRQLDEGSAMLLLNIPPRFHEALIGGEPTAVQLLVDTTNEPQGLSAASYAVRIAGGFGSEIGLASLGLSAAEANLPIVTSAHRVWFNPNQDETWFQSISHLLSGVTTPYESMPRWVQTVMTLSPLRYYIDVTYGVMLKGAGLDVLWKAVGAMLLFGGGLFDFGMWRFRRQFE